MEAATARQTSNGSNPMSDWDQGYGYQFWRSRNGAFRGDGAFGQFCVVLPEHDAVIAITSGVKDMQSVLNLVWDQLLPAMKPAPLGTDQEAHAKLERKLSGLVMPAQEGAKTSATASRVTGKKYAFPANERKLESIALETDSNGEGVTLAVRSDGAVQKIPCGFGKWEKGRLAYGAFAEQPAAASGAWTDADTYKARICFYETPFCVTMTLRFSGDQLLCDTESNVGFGPTTQPQLVGKSE